MNLTKAQRTTLKAFIEADPVLNAYPNTADGNWDLALVLEGRAVPDFICWKATLDTTEVMENGFVWSAVDSLTVGKARIWEWMKDSKNPLSPAKANIRQGIKDAFGVGTPIYESVMVHCKEPCSIIEKVFAVGNGTDASPATRKVYGLITYEELQAVRNGE